MDGLQPDESTSSTTACRVLMARGANLANM
jgi:hypothetical protein